MRLAAPSIVHEMEKAFCVQWRRLRDYKIALICVHIFSKHKIVKTSSKSSFFCLKIWNFVGITFKTILDEKFD